MQRLALAIVGLLAIVHTAHAAYGVDVSSYVSEADFACLKNNGFSFAIIRCYQSTGWNDPNVRANIANAWAAGFSHVDVYFFPDASSNNAASQVQSAISNLNGLTFGQFWIDVENYGGWGSVSYNQNFFTQALVEAVNLLGRSRVGVYSSASQWNPLMGGAGLAYAYPLWYADYDGAQNFNDFTAFGGWTTPNIKQYAGNVYECGVYVDKNWYP